MIEKTESVLRKLREFDLAQLNRESELGQSFNFSAAAGIARLTVDLYKPITLKILGVLPIPKHVQIREDAVRALSMFEAILSFDPSAPDPSFRCSELTVQLGNLYSEIFTSNVGIFAFAKMSGMGKQDIIENVAGIEDKLAKALQAAEQQSKEVEKQASLANQLVAEASAKVGVFQNAEHFKEAADQHEMLADSWLQKTYKAALAMGITAIGFLILSYFVESKDDYASLASRLVIFSALGYILFLCGKSYLSHQHNAVVNRHRQNALSTYSKLVQATYNDEAADIVLSHAAASIFAPQSSGYAKSADAPNAVSLVRSARQITDGDAE